MAGCCAARQRGRSEQKRRDQIQTSLHESSLRHDENADRVSV